jgi:hypothetical protein
MIPTTLNPYNMAHEERIRKALAEIESCSKPNYSAIARKYQLERTILSKRAKGKPTSREEFQSECYGSPSDIAFGDLQRVTVGMWPSRGSARIRDPQEHTYTCKELRLLSSLLSFRF